MNGSSLSAAARFTKLSCCPPPTPLTSGVGALMGGEHTTRQHMIGGAGRGANISLYMRLQAYAHTRCLRLPSPIIHYSISFSPSPLGTAPYSCTCHKGNHNPQSPAAAPEAPLLLPQSICAATSNSSHKLQHDESRSKGQQGRVLKHHCGLLTACMRGENEVVRLIAEPLRLASSQAPHPPPSAPV